MYERKPAKAVSLTGNQLHWLAGMVEAEGSFIAGTPSHPYRVVMHVTTTDLDIAERMSILLGVRISKQKPASPGHKQPYRVVLAGGSAVSLMNLLYPYMGERRRTRIEYAKASHQPRQAWPHLSFQVITDEVAEHERYWLAGYLEGEGCFGLERCVKPYAVYKRPIVTINSTDKDVIVCVQGVFRDRFNINVAVTSVVPKYPGAKVMHTIRARGRNAIKIMRDLYPLLGRRRQAKIMELLAYAK